MSKAACFTRFVTLLGTATTAVAQVIPNPPALPPETLPHWYAVPVTDRVFLGRLSDMSAIEQEYGPPLHMTLDVYWDWREGQELRYEWANGVIYAMTGASRAHNKTVRRLLTMLERAVDDVTCDVWANDMALLLESSGKVYYPDLMVCCPPGTDPRFESSPCLVVEVMSPSTQGRDRTVKLGEYCVSPSLLDYLMVGTSEDQFLIRHRRRGDLWVHTVHGPDDIITLDCPSVTFTVGDLFT